MDDYARGMLGGLAFRSGTVTRQVTPENPTGAVLTQDAVQALGRIAVRHDLLVVADDIYERFVYEGPPHASVAAVPGLADRAILINGFSKTYSMTGWRLGYLVVPGPLVPAMEVIKHTLTICSPAVSKAAGLAALRGPQGCVDELRRIYAERRRILLSGFEALGLGGMPKTTGKRGVHLFVAIERRHTFDEVRAWLKVFLTRLAASHPNVLTLDKRLAERGGKVLVDYSQNAAGKSIAAPYGVRALPGAPVSTPLTWREVAEHPDDERGWFWMSRVAEHAGEKHECLKRVLDLRLAKA